MCRWECLIPLNVALFADEIARRIKEERIFEDALQKAKTMGSWDVAVRRSTGQVVKQVFRDQFQMDPEKAVIVEGSGPDTPKIGELHHDLFGSKVFPDIAIKEPVKIAIELDRSDERGSREGSKFKVALAKSTFNYLSGDWSYCILLFYNRSGKSLDLDKPKEREILQKFENEFHTTCRVINKE
jgi:hypothetical protein